jgi:hypothetical protein
MTSFYRIVLLALSIIFIGIFSIEFLYRDYKTGIDKRFENYYNNEDIEVLLNGNSHVGALGTADNLGLESFNFSVAGQDIFHIYSVLKTALNDENNVKTIVVGIDYDLLGYDYKVANTMWLDRNYYNSTNQLYDSTFSNYLMAQSGFFQSNRDFSYIKNKFLRNPEQENNKVVNNFIPIKGLAKDRALEHSFQKFDTSLIEMNTSYLEKIIFLAENNEIELIIVNLPKQTEYYKHYNKEAVKLGKAILDNYSMKHEIKLIDLWKSQFFSDSDFLDGDHLNEIGANKVLEIIEEYIQNS